MVRSEQDTASGKISFTQGPVDGSDLVLDDHHDDGNDNDDKYEKDAHGNGYSKFATKHVIIDSYRKAYFFNMDL